MADLLTGLGSVFEQARTGALVTGDWYSEFDPRVRAPNAVEWICKDQFLGQPSLYEYVRQFQVVRDFYQLRCPICNSQDPDKVDCWGKGKEYLQSEVLLVWNQGIYDDVCPKCRNTRADFVHDGMLHKYNTLIGVAGMRSGKSVVAGLMATYTEHVLITIGAAGRGALQKEFGQLETQKFEVGFAATTATQTEATIYDVYRQLRAESDWIQHYVRWVKDREKEQTAPFGMRRWEYKELDGRVADGFLRVEYNALNKNSAGLAGRTRVGVFIDELSRFGTSDSPMGAHEVWQVLNNSLVTLKKAAQQNLQLPPWLGMAISTSSPISTEDKQWQLMTSAPQVPSMFSFHYATWEFNPKFTREDFADQYTLDPVMAERDFAANPPAATNPLVSSPKRFWQAIDWNMQPGAIFLKTVPQDKTGREYVGLALTEAQVDRRFERFLRVDAGKSFDAFAICCAHGEWVPSVTALTDESVRDMDPEQYEKMIQNGVDISAQYGSMPSAYRNNELAYGGYYSQRSLPPIRPQQAERSDTIYVTVYDWVVRILPEQNPKRTVWFESICGIVRKLARYVNISQVIFDHWNSESSIQTIREFGVEANVEHLKADDFVKFTQDAYSGKIRMLPPLPEDKMGLTEEGLIVHGVKMSQLSGQGCGLLEILKLERSPDLKKVYNPKKGMVLGENSDDLAQVMIGVHRQVQSYVNAKDNSMKNKLHRSKVGGADWGARGGIFRLSRWS